MTLSPHVLQIDETIFTLKFAKKAKTIKLLIKMNIKNSSDSVKLVVANMKKEVDNAKFELNKFFI